jgi:putative toxin-antitoxin system antitoxin component (TIGR02293 family)
LAATLQRLQVLSEEAQLDQSDLARIFDTSTRTVTRWLRAEATPRRDAHERMLETIVVLDRLIKVLGAGASYNWLLTPVPMLRYEKPIDLLSRGGYRDVIGALDAIEAGVFL